MTDVKSEFQSEFARRYVAIGEARGKAEGEARGEAKGWRFALLIVLHTRGLEVDDAARTRIESCTDLVELHAWITRAVSAPSVAAVFDPEAVVVTAPAPVKKTRRNSKR